jgi:hypothetical protein
LRLVFLRLHRLLKQNLIKYRQKFEFFRALPSCFAESPLALGLISTTRPHPLPVHQQVFERSASSTSNFRVAELVKSFDVPSIAESLDDFRYG